MTIDELEGLFKKHHGEFLKYEKLAPGSTKRRDLRAFILLDKLVPDTGAIISAAEHDEYWLDTDLAKLAEVITEDQVIELLRCGVRYTDCGLGLFA